MATTASCVSACTARMRAAMSLVALAARSASLRISSATTAKRTPDSPAPAASMAALSARRFVCDAISSIVSTISEISSERSPRLLMRLAAAAEVALRDLGDRLEKARDVLLEVLAPPLLLVALGLGGDLGAEPRDGVVEGARELADLVARADAHGVREVATADLLGRAHDLAQRARDPAREDGAGHHRQERDAAEHE